MMRNPLIHVGIALALLVAASAAYAYAYTLVEQKSAEAALLHAELDIKSERTRQLTDAKQALLALGENEELTSRYFVSTENIVVFLENLEAAAAALGADIEVASVSTEPGARERIQVALKITGSFDAVMRTIGIIEYGPYDSQAQSLTLDTPLLTPGKREWTATASFLFGTQGTGAGSPGAIKETL